MNTPPQSPVSCPAPPRLRRSYCHSRGESSFAAQTPDLSVEVSDEELVLEDNVPTYEIISSRSQPRVGGKICIEVKPADSEVVEKWPLEAFVDEDGFFTDETVCKWVNDWNEKAALHPDVHRTCLMCARKAKKALTLCGHCFSKGLDEIIYG